MQGTMAGARRRGRPRTAWMDNIKTWTGLSMEESIRMTEDRDKWRKYVHSVALGSRMAKDQIRYRSTCVSRHLHLRLWSHGNMALYKFCIVLYCIVLKTGGFCRWICWWIFMLFCWFCLLNCWCQPGHSDWKKTLEFSSTVLRSTLSLYLYSNKCTNKYIHKHGRPCTATTFATWRQ